MSKLKLTNKAAVTIKPFQTGIDVPADIARIHLKIRKWEIEVYQTSFTDILDSQADLNAIYDYYVAPGGNFLLAKAGNQIIGFTGLRNDGGGHGVMKRLAVVPEYQHHGIGTELIAESINWAKLNGFTKLSLHTGIREKARPLYEKFGFEVLGFREERHDQYMELDLTASAGK